jgi:hypothetical protein
VGSLISFPAMAEDGVLRQKLVGAVGAGLRDEGGGSFFALTGVDGILDWITPRGQPLNPSLSRNVKIDRGFHHERTGALLCPVGLDWSNNE